MALDRAPNSPQANQPVVQAGGLPTRQANTVLEEIWRQVVAAFGAVPCIITGTNVLTLTPRLHKEGAATYGDGMIWTGAAQNTSTGAVTAAVVPASGAGALPTVAVFKDNGATPAGAGDIVIDCVYLFVFNQALDAGNGGFVLK